MSDRAASFWIERVSSTLGFDYFSTDNRNYGPAVLLGVTALIDVFVLSLARSPESGRLFINNPGAVPLILGWPLVVLVMMRLRDDYVSVVDSLPDPIHLPEGEYDRPRSVSIALLDRIGLISTEDGGFYPIFPNRHKVGIWILAAGFFHLLWITFEPPGGVVSPESQLFPFQWALKFYVFIPLTYYVGATEFVSLFLGIHLLLPFRIRQAELIDFDDHLLYGGLRPVGKLLRTSAIAYLLLVSLLIAFLVQPGGVELSARFPLFIVSSATVFGALLFFAPIWWIHRHMKSAKESKIHSIAQHIRGEFPPDDELITNIDFEDLEEPLQYGHEYRRLTHVENMHEYPVDISLIQEFLLILLLPYFASISSTVVVNYVPPL